MLKKNIDKQERRNRQTWIGYTSKMTPTKKTRMYRQERKHRNKQALSSKSWQSSYFTSILEGFYSYAKRLSRNGIYLIVQ